MSRHLEGAQITGLCSAGPTLPFEATGSLGAAQFARLDRLLADSSDAVRVLLLHHPPLPGLVKARERLQDADVLAEILQRRGVDLILHGHLHCNRMIERGQMRVFCTGPASSADASFRLFDIESTEGAPQITARLWQRAGVGEFQQVDSQT